MSFFYGQESLTIIQWGLRGIIAFFVLLLSAKMLGQRSISQLRLLDFIIAITLGNILAHPLSDEELGMTGSITTTAVLIILYILSILFTLKSKKFEEFLAPAPIPLVKNGEIIYKNLGRAKISLDFLLSELRLKKVDDLRKIAIALWEPGGKISVFLETNYQTLTPNDMQILTTPFSLPVVVIKDGVIDINALKDINITKSWLIDRLTNIYNTEVEDVLLATLDVNFNLQVYFR